MKSLEYMQKTVVVDNQTYHVDAVQRTLQDPSKVHVLIPTLILSELALEMVKVCVQSFMLFSENNVEIWVVDNNSPKEFAEKLVAWDMPINILLNRTEPENPYFSPSLILRLKRLRSGLKKLRHKQMYDGSYANGVALEIGRAFLPDQTQCIFTVHSDTCVTHKTWLDEYKKHLSASTPVVGGYIDHIRINALHISSLMIDYQWLMCTNETLMPNLRQERYADRPEYDVGDSASWRARHDQLIEYCLPNTQDQPSLVDMIPEEHFFKDFDIPAFVFGSDGEIIFTHLRRGTRKSTGLYQQEKKLMADQWVQLMQRFFSESSNLMNQVL